MKSGKFSISKIVKVGTEFALIEASGQVVNALPGIPPAVKVLVGMTAAFATYEILGQMVPMLPPAVRGIAKGVIEVNSVLLAVQQIPNIIAAFSSLGQTVTQ